MRYHYEKPDLYSTIYGSTYNCDHPVYNKCTLFKINDKGLAVIQQRYNPVNKATYWNDIDPWLMDELYLHAKFEDFFNERAGECKKWLVSYSNNKADYVGTQDETYSQRTVGNMFR